jgi:hypothetical protein
MVRLTLTLSAWALRGFPRVLPLVEDEKRRVVADECSIVCVTFGVCVSALCS